MIFHAESESDLKTSPNQVKNPILLKIRFFIKNWAAASAEGLLNIIFGLGVQPLCSIVRTHIQGILQGPSSNHCL